MFGLIDPPSNTISNFCCIYQQNKWGKLSQTSLTPNELLSTPLHSRGTASPYLSRLGAGSEVHPIFFSHCSSAISLEFTGQENHI